MKRVGVAGSAVVVILSLSVAVALQSNPAAATPSTPYDAFTINGAVGSYVLGGGAYSYDPSNATFNLQAWGPDGVLFSTTGTKFWTSIVQPPTGGSFTLETTYPTLRFPDATHAGLDVSGDGRGCNQQGGWVVVHEFTRDPDTQAVTAFAATYSENCELTQPAITGEIRWHSSVDYKGLITTPFSLAFGNVKIGQDSVPKTVTISGVGSVSTTLGTPSLNGTGVGTFRISADTCTNAVLGYGATCTISVIAHPSNGNFSLAYLVIPDDTVAGQRVVELSATGTSNVFISISPSVVSFGTVTVGTTSPPQTVTFTSTGPDTAVFGTAALSGATPEAFSITSDTCSGRTLSTGQSCSVGVASSPTSITLQQATLVIPDNSNPGQEVVPLAVNGQPDPTGTYYPLRSTRLLDTRAGLGAPRAAVGPHGVVHLQVTGRGGVPTGVSAVVLNVTVTTPTASSFLTVYPSGVVRPGASSLNFVAGWTGANSVTVGVGTNGKVDIYNQNGSVQVIADVVGFYASMQIPGSFGLGGEYQLAVTERLLDTRTWGFGPVPGGYLVGLPVDFGSAVNPHIRALAVNITAVNPAASGFLTAYDGADSVPGSSTLNFTAHVPAVPNLAIVPVSPCGFDPSCAGLPMIAVYNGSTGSTHILVDIFGLFDDNSLGGGLRFHPMTPTRIVDSRINLGTSGALGAAVTRTIAAPGSVAGPDTAALALNVTAVNPTASTYLTVWSAGPRPTVSNLNPRKGQTVPNAVMCELDLSNQFEVYNSVGAVHLLVDVVGSYELGPNFAGLGTTPSPGSGRALTANLGLPAYLTRQR